MTQTGLQEFKATLRDFRYLGSLAVKGTVIVPLMNLWLKLGPPPAAAISVTTSAIEFLAVMWTFQFWYSTSRKRLNRRMKVCGSLFCFRNAHIWLLV
jgi:hypothetical protein